MDDKFSLSEFTAEGELVDANSRFRDSHDPRLGYIHTQKLLSTVNQDVHTLSDDDQPKAKVYSRVAVFREAIQYVEEFGIYLYSELDEDTDFIDALVRTDASDLKPLFTEISEDGFDSALSTRVDDSENWLKKLLGYDLLEKNDVEISELVDNPEELSVESRSEAIQNSLDSAKSKIEHIAEFFIQFSEPYNAVKHGNRVTIQEWFEGAAEIDGEEYELEIDEPMAEFLCKKSGDHGGGRPYVFIAPTQMLSERSSAIVDITNEIYEGIYKMERCIADAESSKSDEITSFRYTFYDITKSEGNGVSHQFLIVDNPDMEMWIPHKYAPEELKSAPGKLQTQVAFACRLRGDELVIETELDRSISNEYPLAVESTLSKKHGQLARSIFHYDFDIDLWNLPVWQYREFLRLESAGPFSSLRMVVNTGEETTQGTYRGDVNFPTLPQKIDDRYLELLENVGKATDTDIHTPLYLEEGDLELMDEYIDSSLTRDDANEFLSEMEGTASDRVYSLINLFLVDEDSSAKEGYIISNEVSSTGHPGAYIREFDEENQLVDIQPVDGTDPRYDSAHDPESLFMGAFEEEQDDVFEMFRSNTLDWRKALDNLSESEWSQSPGSFVQITRTGGPRQLWYELSKLEIAVFDEVPDYIEE